jgi:hypothetical protein
VGPGRSQSREEHLSLIRCILVPGVGYYNQAHFLRFLIYVDLGTSYHLLMMIYRIRDFGAWQAVRPVLPPQAQEPSESDAGNPYA